MTADNPPDNADNAPAPPGPHCFCRGENGGRYPDYRNGRGGRITLCDHTPVLRP